MNKSTAAGEGDEGLDDAEPDDELDETAPLSNDGMVYVCDRLANRLQVFDKMGNFKRSIDLPWKKYTADNEDLRKYCLTQWRTFPPSDGERK